MLVSRNQLPLMAGGSIFNTWQFAFQYGGLKHTHNKNKTQLKTVIILDCLEGNIVREASEYPGAGRQACRQAGRRVDGQAGSEKCLVVRRGLLSLNSAWLRSVAAFHVPCTVRGPGASDVGYTGLLPSKSSHVVGSRMSK